MAILLEKVKFEKSSLVRQQSVLRYTPSNPNFNMAYWSEPQKRYVMLWIYRMFITPFCLVLKFFFTHVLVT